MKTIKVKVYEFKELNTEAQEKAVQWYQEGLFYDGFWCEHITGKCGDADNVGLRIDSFDCYRQEIKGDFKGLGMDTAKKIILEHGKKTETYKTAENFLKAVLALGEIPDLNAPYSYDEEKAHDDKVNEYDERKEELEKEFLKDILGDYLHILR